MTYIVTIARHATQTFNVEAESREQAREAAHELVKDTSVRPHETDNEILEVREAKIPLTDLGFNPRQPKQVFNPS